MARPVFSDRPWYGGDYNPEQWPEDVWVEDVRLMTRAGVNLATVGVFSWAKIEPVEGTYEFEWLDRVLDGLHAAGIRVDLATATASPPAWLAATHPEVRPVTADGVTLWHGSRQAYCPSSPVYRAAAGRLVAALAERYGEHPALQLWHINNEYGCHVSHCWCEVSAAAFRRWLEEKYATIESLNEAWGTAFWSQQYADFSEIEPPRTTPAYPNPAQSLDFDRFSTDELLACFIAEKEILRKVTPDIPVTTNFMGLFPRVDYWRWAPHVDVVSDDLYPDPADPDAGLGSTMARDLMRSLGRGKSWLLMEQAAGAVNTRPRNAPKAPGQMRALSYQALARGADGILLFQWRQSAVGAERFHSAMLPHSGPDSRVFREVVELGGELARLGDLMGEPVPAQAAIVFDWESWWALRQKGMPSDVSYPHVIADWHRALTGAGVVVDFVHGDEDLTGYPLVVAPSLFVATDAQIAALDAAARAGSSVLVTWQSAIVDETMRVRLDGYLGALQATLGVWVEEFVPLAGAHPAHPTYPEATPPPTVEVTGSALPGGRTTGIDWAEVVRVTDASVEATFTGGMLDGMPALTRRATGSGAAWYLATRLDRAATAAVVDTLLAEAGIVVPAVHRAPASGWVETVRRGDVIVVINHGTETVQLDVAGRDLLSGHATSGMMLGPQGVAVVRPEAS